jgi:hypothetical protein
VVNSYRVVRHPGSQIFLDNQLTYGNDVSLTLLSRKIPDTQFFYTLSEPQGHSAAGRIR